MKYTVEQYKLILLCHWLVLKHNTKKLLRKPLVFARWKWCQLYVRKDEFHKSLSLDTELLMYMNKQEQDRYLKDLVKRRNIAHGRES